MSKPSPASTGQADAAAQNQIWQQLISQEEAYQDSQNQEQRGAAAALDQPNSGLNNAGTTRPDAMKAQGGSVPQQSAPAESAAAPINAPAPMQVNAGTPTPQGAGRQPVNAMQHLANAVSPGARVASGQMGTTNQGGPSDAQAAQAATQKLADPSQMAPAPAGPPQDLGSPQGQPNWQMTPNPTPQRNSGGFFPPLSPQAQQQVLAAQNGANQP